MDAYTPVITEYAKKYDRKPGAIKDPEYSIECGIQALKGCLKKAGVQDPLDMERIKLALGCLEIL